MVRIPPSGKCIRLVFINHIDSWHWKFCPLSKSAHNTIQFRGFGLSDLPSSIHLEHYLIAEPIADEINTEGYDKRECHACFPPKNTPYSNKHQGKRHHEQHCFETIHCLPPLKT